MTSKPNPEPTTMFELAQRDEAAQADSRYPKVAAPVTGTDPTQPMLPPCIWSRDPCGIEPPLGERVDDLPDLTKVQR